jgi:hypothetical protein
MGPRPFNRGNSDAFQQFLLLICPHMALGLFTLVYTAPHYSDRSYFMEPIVLTDPNQFPMEIIIFSHIGKIKPLWISLFKYIEADHSDFVSEWRYYRDGKS